MVKNKILRVSAVAVASAGLMLGMAGIAGASSSSGVLGTTGPDSFNKIISQDSTRLNSQLDVANRNNVFVGNTTDQAALSGDASQRHNTTGGDVTTGDTMNHSAVSTMVSLTNTTPSMTMPAAVSGGGSNSDTASIGTTGPDSSNVVVSRRDFSVSERATVQNTNNVAVFSHTDQVAASGDASSSGNTTGGDVMTGAASNVSTTSTTLTINN
jgi:hypothetical protein